MDFHLFWQMQVYERVQKLACYFLSEQIHLTHEISQRKFGSVKRGFILLLFSILNWIGAIFTELTMMDEDYLSDDKIATRTVNLDDIVPDKKETKKIHFNEVSSQYRSVIPKITYTYM
jgi:hypothetical protein